MGANLIAILVLVGSNALASADDFWGQRCGNNDLAILGAQKTMNADLAIDFVKERYLQLPPTKVAVIDTGWSKSSNDLVSSPVKKDDYASGPLNFILKKIFDRGQDSDGHGTAVASLINGKFGIGVNPWAEVSSFKSNLRQPQDAIIQACEKGNKIINLSAASDLMRMIGQDIISGWRVKAWPFSDESIEDFLNRKGCMVFQSAGNTNLDWSVLNNRSKFSTGPLYYVGGLNRFGSRAVSLNSGQVFAPSELVFTVRNPMLSLDAGLKCYSDQFVILSGTSFGAPLTSGSASLIRSVLSTNKEYGKLSGQIQNQVLGSIINLASQKFGLDLYLAVRLADRLATVVNAEYRSPKLGEGIGGSFQAELLNPDLGLSGLCRSIDLSRVQNLEISEQRKAISLCRLSDDLTIITQLSELLENLEEKSLQESDIEEYLRLTNYQNKLKRKPKNLHPRLAVALEDPQLDAVSRIIYSQAIWQSFGYLPDSVSETILADAAQSLESGAPSSTDLERLVFLNNIGYLKSDFLAKALKQASSWPLHKFAIFLAFDSWSSADRVKGLKLFSSAVSKEQERKLQVDKKKDFNLRGTRLEKRMQDDLAAEQMLILGILQQVHRPLSTEEFNYIRSFKAGGDVAGQLLLTLSKRGTLQSELPILLDYLEKLIPMQSQDAYLSHLPTQLAVWNPPADIKQKLFMIMADNWTTDYGATELIKGLGDHPDLDKKLIVERLMRRAERLKVKLPGYLLITIGRYLSAN